MEGCSCNDGVGSIDILKEPFTLPLKGSFSISSTQDSSPCCYRSSKRLLTRYEYAINACFSLLFGWVVPFTIAGLYPSVFFGICFAILFRCLHFLTVYCINFLEEAIMNTTVKRSFQLERAVGLLMALPHTDECGFWLACSALGLRLQRQC